MKICKKCSLEKEFLHFKKSPAYKDGYMSSCISCQKSYRKAHYQANKEHNNKTNKAWNDRNKNYYKNKYKNNKNSYRHSQLMIDFSISLQEYDLMMKAQDGKCRICEVNQSDCKKNFAVDHCHTTNKIRGLLCNKCNVGLGMFNDNHIILQKAIVYLGE